MENLKKAVKRFMQNLMPPDTVGGIGYIKSMEVNGLHPLNRRGFAKSGNLSLSGRVGTQKVKLSSMFTEKQVDLRLRVTMMSEKIHLPPVIASEGRIIVEEWINGRSPSQLDREFIRRAIRDYLQDNERFSYSSADLCDFDYLNYLEQRVLDWYFLRGVPSFLERWRGARAALAGEMRLALCNPDLSFENFIIEAGTERIFMIDTEFLHVGDGWFMDHHNSAVRHEPLTAGISPKLSLFVRNCISLRKIGSALIAGRPDLLTEEMLEFQDG